MPDKKITSGRDRVVGKPLASLTQARLKTGIKTVDQSIVDELTKAFGDEVAYHIKESGPTWVNSPHHIEAGERVSPEIVERTVQITVHNAKEKGGG
jgi:hypothetical protein